jgi:sigma-B regulation protein RsbU (phosphoserine phosphatase)
MDDFNALNEELAKLKNEKAALQVQGKLLENFVTMARSSAKEKMLTTTLQQTLEVAAELTGAEKGSLFLRDRDGAVTDSILTRRGASAEQRSQLIGKVLDKGLIGWVLQYRRIGLIFDTETDDRWLDLPDQPYSVRSALAVPILVGDKLLGLLTLLHPDPGHFSEETAELMQLTAGQIGFALENTRLYAKLDKSYRSLEKAKMKIETYSKALDVELEKGRRIQKEFLPDQIPQPSGWDLAAYFHPARQVSGDFYDIFFLPGNHVGLVIADVCDKGVGSALFMALFRSLIRVFSGQINLSGWSATGSDTAASQSGLDVAETLQAIRLTNDYIANEHGQEGMFATMFFGVLNSDTGELAYINSGHEPLFIIGSSGIKATLRSSGTAVGMLPDLIYKIGQVTIEPGDTLIGYTDGVTEAESLQHEFFSKKRFLALLENAVPSASELIERIKIEIFKHIDNAPQFDDITMLAVHRKI